MNRRTLLGGGLALVWTTRLWGQARAGRFDEAAQILDDFTRDGTVTSAVLEVISPRGRLSRAFGRVRTADAMFLLGSISKPIAVMALLSLLDEEKLALDDRVRKYLPKFKGEGRDDITIRHLLTHVSGLPDQVKENARLRKSHAPLHEFIDHAQSEPLAFAPGTKYSYSSMGILLASHIAERISGESIHRLVERRVFGPLEMKHSAQGLGAFKLDDMVPVQIEHAAPEAGGGAPTAREWDWNSPYWRKLGAPWGGTHASAPDIGRLLEELLHEQGKVLRPATARDMVRNHNEREGLAPRGLGWNVGAAAGSAGCSRDTFGHTGSTGTICWCDRQTKTICVVLTSLPGRARTPHPRELAGARVAAAAG